MPNFEHAGEPTVEEQPVKKPEGGLDDILAGIDTELKDKGVEDLKDRTENNAEKELSRLEAIEKLEAQNVESVRLKGQEQQMDGASVYALLKDDPQAYTEFVEKKAKAHIDSERSELNLSEMQKESGLYRENDQWQHYTDEQWQKRNNSSEGFAETMDNWASSKRKSIEGGQEDLRVQTEMTPEQRTQIMEFRKRDLKEGNYHDTGGALRGVTATNPDELVREVGKRYEKQFDYQKKYGFENLDKTLPEAVKISEGIVIASLESGDMEIAAKTLAFLESTPNPLSPEILEKVQKVLASAEVEKKQAFSETLKKARLTQRLYREEIATKSNQPLYQG